MRLLSRLLSYHRTVAPQRFQLVRGGATCLAAAGIEPCCANAGSITTAHPAPLAERPCVSSAAPRRRRSCAAPIFDAGRQHEPRQLAHWRLQEGGRIADARADSPFSRDGGN